MHLGGENGGLKVPQRPRCVELKRFIKTANDTRTYYLINGKPEGYGIKYAIANSQFSSHPLAPHRGKVSRVGRNSCVLWLFGDFSTFYGTIAVIGLAKNSRIAMKFLITKP